MLQQMRRLPKWVAFIAFLPLVISFGIWGIGDIFRGAVDTSVASVGGTKIDLEDFTRTFENIRRNAAQRAGGQLSEAKVEALGRSTLQSMIGETALDNVVHRLGLESTDDQVASTIRTIPAFRGPLGAFDEATFRQTVTRLNFTEVGFVAEIRRELARDQLNQAGAGSIALPPDYIRAFFLYLNERRAVQYVVLPPDAAGAIAPPSDQVLTTYVKAHQAQFSTPEYRELTYAVIGPDDVANQVQVTDAQLRQTYELRKDIYVIAEKRDIQRINFPDEASAKAARAKIDAGAKFEDIAKARGLTPNDLDLGTLTQADLGPAQGPAAFTLPIGTVTQPVKYTFGWSLLRTTAITPGSTKTFEDVEPTLKAELTKQLAGSRVEDILNAYDDAHNSGDDLAEAAKKAGMRVVHVAATDAQGLAPGGSKADVPASSDFLDQVFKSDIGDEGDPFQASDGRRYVLKVDGDVPSKLKSLDSVRAQALAAWSAEQGSAMLAAKAAQLAKQAGSGAGLSAIAAQHHLAIQSSDALVRDTPTPVFNEDFNTKIFASPPGQAISGPGASGTIVARVTGIVHPPIPLGDPRYQQFVQLLGNQIGSDIQESMGTAARAAQGSTINQQQLDRAIGGEGS